MLECIQSSELIILEDKKYIAVHLKEKYIPFFNINGKSIRHNPIVLQEPTKADYNAISKLSIALNKLCTVSEERQINLLNSLKSDELLDQIINTAKDRVNEQGAKQIVDENLVRSTISSILYFANSYEDGDNNYFTICDNFRDFIGGKIGYETSNIFVWQSMLDFENYDKFFQGIEPCDFQKLTEELISTYIGFFFASFRSTLFSRLIANKL
jgi:hypothetical protein